ncbi:hypothetical protein BESB_061440 [Besnoitia besnoiti]|uniref:Uncharacterized protein n=1 Tax=Besnoitia besnoiti TaxID=94643 RepID=A0A2A9MI37_BESBE|nr:hypothetical protein BESB_061440 [Besnoitia besnoiti]PFH35257.1 hypothetical protein BESB_061440 [Besnoitia besnoiti]
MAGSSVSSMTKNADLQYAIKRILKQHQRECEDAADFGKAREAQAALNELQHRCEFEGLCRLFCQQYQQLADVDEAHRKQLRTLEMQWKTVQLPSLVDRIRKWRTQLQERQSAELQNMTWQEAEDSKSKPKFRKEAFDLQKKMQYLGHQGRYDEAEEVQRQLLAQQRLDAQEHEASRQARIERQAARLSETHEAERAAFEARVERLIEYSNRQNAATVDTLRRKHGGLRKSITHVQGLELQKALHALKCLKPDEGVRLVRSVVATHMRNSRKTQQGSSASGEGGGPKLLPFSQELLLQSCIRTPTVSEGLSSPVAAPSGRRGPTAIQPSAASPLSPPGKSRRSSLPRTFHRKSSSSFSSDASRRSASQAAALASHSRQSTSTYFRSDTALHAASSPRAGVQSETKTLAAGERNRAAPAVGSARGKPGADAQTGWQKKKVPLLPEGADALHEEILSSWKEGAAKVLRDRQSLMPLR